MVAIFVMAATYMVHVIQEIDCYDGHLFKRNLGTLNFLVGLSSSSSNSSRWNLGGTEANFYFLFLADPLCISANGLNFEHFPNTSEGDQYGHSSII